MANKARFAENLEPLRSENTRGGPQKNQKRASPLGASMDEAEVTEFPAPKKRRSPGTTPKGPGYVVQLRGYHFHNSPTNGSGKQFVQRTLVHNLQERDIALPGSDGEVSESGTSELGISHPLVFGTEEQKVISPFGNDKNSLLTQYQFVVQFAWQPEGSH